MINRAKRQTANRREVFTNHSPWVVLSLRFTLLVLAIEYTIDLPWMGGLQFLGRALNLLSVDDRLTIHLGPVSEYLGEGWKRMSMNQVYCLTAKDSKYPSLCFSEVQDTFASLEPSFRHIAMTNSLELTTVSVDAIFLGMQKWDPCLMPFTSNDGMCSVPILTHLELRQWFCGVGLSHGLFPSWSIHT